MEKIWKVIFKLFGTTIAFSPFIRNLLFQWGLSDDRFNLTWTDIFTVAIGFSFAWGGNYFGKWANGIGNKIVSTMKNKS